MLASKTMACLLKCPNTFWDKDTAVLTEKKQPRLFISFFLPLIHTASILYYCLIGQLSHLILRVSAFLRAIKPTAALHMLYTLAHTVDPAGSCRGSCIKHCLESNATFSTAPEVHSSLLSPSVHHRHTYTRGDAVTSTSALIGITHTHPLSSIRKIYCFYTLSVFLWISFKSSIQKPFSPLHGSAWKSQLYFPELCNTYKLNVILYVSLWIIYIYMIDRAFIHSVALF